MLRRISFAVIAFNLTACAGSAPTGYSACTTQPGSYACQIEQYERVND